MKTARAGVGNDIPEAIVASQSPSIRRRRYGMDRPIEPKGGRGVRHLPDLDHRYRARLGLGSDRDEVAPVGAPEWDFAVGQRGELPPVLDVPDLDGVRVLVNCKSTFVVGVSVALGKSRQQPAIGRKGAPRLDVESGVGRDDAVDPAAKRAAGDVVKQQHAGLGPRVERQQVTIGRDSRAKLVRGCVVEPIDLLARPDVPKADWGFRGCVDQGDNRSERDLTAELLPLRDREDERLDSGADVPPLKGSALLDHDFVVREKGLQFGRRPRAFLLEVSTVDDEEPAGLHEHKVRAIRVEEEAGRADFGPTPAM